MTSEERRRMIEAQEFFGLRNAAVVEKDWYVVKAMQAIATVETGPFALVFGGGTCLARAHKLTQRMSEDIDFKIVPSVGNETLGGGALKRQLSDLKHRTAEALASSGFQFNADDRDQVRSQNQNQYSIFQIPYPSELGKAEGLRPSIQIELKLDPLLLPPVQLSVSSFVAEAFKESPEIPKIACVAMTEIAVEKLIALTRRVSMEVAEVTREPDETLVRHLYDLHHLRHEVEHPDFRALVKTVMAQDAQDFGNQFPEYSHDPIGQTQKAMRALATNPIYRHRYDAFARSMVYGEAPPFTGCIRTTQDFIRAADLVQELGLGL